VVVVAGNHDSPTFLEAPKELLRALDVHVIGSAAEDPADEVLVLRDPAGTPELIVCAVPYLRDRDIRRVEAGEDSADKEIKLSEGIRDHYASVTALAEARRADLGADIPLVAMGHLFTAGGKTLEGDGVRELYVGSLAHVSPGIFPDSLDYLALGHLHVPQRVGNTEARRYSGSPLPMGFGEARQEKSLCLVEWDKGNGVRPESRVRLIPIPVFQPLERIQGDWDRLAERLQALVATGSSTWIEVIYEGEAVISDLRERLEALLAGGEETSTRPEILRVRNNRIVQGMLKQMHEEESLGDLNELEVFARCLDAQGVEAEQQADLLRAYQEILATFHHADPLAE
jgi:exonuclease SbcD